MNRPVFPIPECWTPQQALAVFELLDELRERIWNHYDLYIIQAHRAELESNALPSTDDPPF